MGEKYGNVNARDPWIGGLPLCHRRDGPCNLGMCSDWEFNPRSSGEREKAPINQATLARVINNSLTSTLFLPGLLYFSHPTFINTPSILQPQDSCSCYTLYLEYWFPRKMCGSFPHFLKSSYLDTPYFNSLSLLYFFHS